jgi:hypothetical protein
MFNYLLGPKIPLANKLRETCGMIEDDYCKFVYTFFLSCQLQSRVSALHKNESINKDYLMANETFNACWRLLDSAGKQTTGERNDPLWIQIKRLFNEQARVLICLMIPSLST